MSVLKDFLRFVLCLVWDVFLFLLKTALLAFILLIFFAVISQDSTAEEGAIFTGISILCSLCICWKPFRRKRSKRKQEDLMRELTHAKPIFHPAQAKHREPQRSIHQKSATPRTNTRQEEAPISKASSETIDDNLRQFIHKAQWHAAANDNVEEQLPL